MRNRISEVAGMMREAGKAFSHLFFPACCYGCGRDIQKQDQIICLHCLENLPATNFLSLPGNPVEKIFWGRLDVQEAASHFYFSKESTIARLIHLLKYNGRKETGFFLGSLMGMEMLQSGRFKDLDGLIPLPLFRKKEQSRGYNQALIICEGIASVLKLEVLKDVVIRTSGTESQTQKGRIDRWRNMQDRFSVINPHKLKGKKVLLVDDVITTGATLEACGKVILAEQTELSILTLAFSSSKNL